VLTDQLIRDLVKRNWGDDEYPYFRFNPVSNEQMRWMVNTWSQMIQSGAVLPTEEDEARLRAVLEMPSRKEDSVPLQSVTPPAPMPQPSALAPKPDDASPPETARMVAAFKRAQQRVNFEVIDRRQAFLSNNLARDLGEVTARATARIMGTDEQLAALIDSDPADIGGVDLTGVEKGKLKTLSSKALNSSWRVGQSMAIEEIGKAGRVKNKRVSMADLRESAAQFFEANGFRMAGNLSDGVRGIIQQELLNSVKFGRSPAQTREAIWLRLTTKGFTTREAVRTAETSAGVLRALDALWADSEETAAAYLDTLSRTNLFEAMNEARYAEYTDPEMGDFVLALRYSAILDSRTTHICSAMHDRIYKVGNPVWDDLRPPNHYNCRSVLVPITQVDADLGEWDGEESSPPTVKPQAGFG
jgi:SPP1 gp7 family putative phage head morphogenesis protein